MSFTAQGSQTLAAWVQAIGSIGAILGAFWISARQSKAALQSVTTAQLLAERSRQKSILAIAEAANAHAKRFGEAVAAGPADLMLIYDRTIINGIADALGRAPAHELGSRDAVIALLSLRDQFVFLGITLDAFIAGPWKHPEMRELLEQLSGPDDRKQQAQVLETSWRVLAKNVTVHVTKIREDYESLARAVTGKEERTLAKITELKDEHRQKWFKLYNDHLELLRRMQQRAVRDTQKYLWASNAGAAVALMAFMGANDVVRASSAAWISLTAFFLGIIALGALRALIYHLQTKLFKGWVLHTTKASSGEIDAERPIAWINDQTKKRPWLPVALAYLSFACFIFGCVWAATHLPRLAAVEPASVTATPSATTMAAAAITNLPAVPPEHSWGWKVVHDPNATFAGAVALFTLALVAVGAVQAAQLNRTVRATRDAAAALPKIERAYVFVDVQMPAAPTLTPKGTAQSHLRVDITNHGRTPAFLDQIRAVAHVTTTRPDKLPTTDDDRPLPSGFALKAGTRYPQNVYFRVSQDEWTDVVGLNGPMLFCYGRIQYRDALGGRRETGFCMEYQERSDFKGFQLSPDTPLNYWT